MVIEVYADESGHGFCWRLRDEEESTVLAESGFSYETPAEAEFDLDRVRAALGYLPVAYAY